MSNNIFATFCGCPSAQNPVAMPISSFYYHNNMPHHLNSHLDQAELNAFFGEVQIHKMRLFLEYITSATVAASLAVDSVSS
jgi:hypothetical protein